MEKFQSADEANSMLLDAIKAKLAVLESQTGVDKIEEVGDN